MSQFKIFGYSVDFYQNKKLVGSLILDAADRDWETIQPSL